MITNTPSVKSEELDICREGFEHRAAWMYWLLEEAEKAGLDDEFARKAIFNCGCFLGKNVTPQTDDVVEFAMQFTKDAKDVYEMDYVNVTPERVDVEFHYCPMLNAWKKFTDDEAKLARLCDIAMCGDRGTLSEYEQFEFHLGRTIADGNPVCEVGFSKISTNNKGGEE